VRALGRIIAGLLGLPLLLLGAFGLVSAYMPEAGLLEPIRGILDSGHRASIEAGFAAPIDQPKQLEALVSGPIVRFVLAPAGCLLLALAIFIPSNGGSKKKKKKKADDESELDAFDEALQATDKRSQKKLLKTAAALKKQGEIEEAAQMMWTGGELDKAAEYYIEGGMYSRAAEVRHDQNRFIESAELYLEGGAHDSAGAIFAQQEEWTRAGDCYLEAENLSVAAEMYEKGENWRKAAQCYDKVEFHRHAASAFVKVQEWEHAARCLDKVFEDEAPKSRNDSNKLAELQKLARQAAKLYGRARQPDRAKELLERAECWPEAADVAMSLERFAEAAEFFRNAGQLERAADALRNLGEHEAAARIMGEFHRDRGELKEAAGQLADAGDFADAGDLYRQLEDYEQSGECYSKQGDYLGAAEMFRMAGDRMRAGECYERVQRFTEAAECFALEGIPEKEAELLDKAGQHLPSGEVYHRQGIDDEAITVLQKVPPDHEDFAKASALLGDIFRARGQLSLAVKKLEQSIGGSELDRHNMPIFYTLATIFEADGQLVEAFEIYEKILGFDYHYQDVEQRLVGLRDRVPAAGAVPAAKGVAGAGGATAQSMPTASSQPGRYEIVGELGRGGMGIVYKAKDTVLDRTVAYKVLPDNFKENAQAVENFLREAKAAAKLNHPNIVTVYDTGEQDGRYYIAMEFVDGTTLKEILRRRGKISPAGILHVIVQVSEALAYAHENRVVHRDIKPANTMWTRDKKAKIMDFGLAKVVEEVRNHTTVVAGTPYYMSPEQTLGKNIDHRTDIYSLGVTIYEMATGTVPFKEGNIPYHHVHTPAPDVRQLRPDLPEPLPAIVTRCLAKDPADRYQSAREVLAKIRGALAGSSQSKTKEG